MALPTATEVKAYAEKFSSLSDIKVDLFIETAMHWVNSTKWGAKYKTGMILMTCHLLELDSRNGAGGSITSEKVGDLSVSYGSANAPGDESLGATGYGATFLSLRKTLPRTPFII